MQVLAKKFMVQLKVALTISGHIDGIFQVPSIMVMVLVQGIMME
jgi:hypothetical protein